MSSKFESTPCPSSWNDDSSHSLPLNGLHRPNAGLSTMSADLIIENNSDSPANSVGRYPVSGEIARGGMGAILRGRDPDLGRDLAIKVLLNPSHDPEVVRRFVEEAQIGGQLQHPGIVPVYEIGHFGDNQPYFTMKLVEGRTLAHLLQERTTPAQDLPRFLGIFQHTCLTMAYAHDRGVIHRDLKPGNIMVGSFGEVLVMDWGLAKVLNRCPDKAPASDACESEIRTVRSGQDGSASVAGTVSGTPAYMAPEQARGEIKLVDARADVFALGSILCEILTGRPAYESSSSENTYWRALNCDLTECRTNLDGCSADPKLLQLARSCLEPDTEDRPRDASVVAQEITAYLDGVQVRLRQAEVDRAAAHARTVSETKSRRLRRTLGGLLTLTLLGLTLAGWWTYDKRVRLLHEVESDLTEAVDRQGKGDWPAARAAAERASGRLGTSGPAELQARLRHVREELNLLERLEQIRLNQTQLNDGHFDRSAAIQEYAEAFQQVDLDVRTLAVDEAARRLAASPIREQLLTALDDWLLLLHDAHNVEWKRLLEVVQAADPDAQRIAMRTAWATQDAQRLRQLATPEQAASLPPSTALFVAAAPRRAQATNEALQVLEVAQREHPGDFWLNHRLAFTLHHFTTRQEEAVGYYRAALAIRPESAGVYVNLSGVLERLGRYSEAEDAARKAVQLQKDYAEAHTNLSYFLRRRGRLNEAEASLQEALRLKPGLANANLNLFYLREQQGRPEEAAAAMRQALEHEPDNAAAHFDFGVFLLKQGQKEAAKVEFRQAVALQRQNAAYHFQLAYLLEKLGDVEAAEQEYRTVISLKGKLAQAHTNLGAILFARGHFAEAEQEHRAALAADPKLAVAYLNLGMTLARESKVDDATQAFHDALRLNANFGGAYYQLARLQLRQGQNAAAVENFREALRCDTNDADVHGQYGVALARLEKLAEAETEFRAAVARDGDFPEWQCRLGQVLCEQGRFGEGCDLIRKGHERGTARQGWSLPSEQWLKAAERNAALEKKLRAVLADAVQPRDGAEWLEFAQVCQAKKQYAEAVKCYQSAFTANPNLATDYRNGGGRSRAARVAVLAASGEKSEALDETTRARLRQQALTWLRAEVTGWERGLGAGSPAFREQVRRSLETMQRDPAFAAVRDDSALERLPEGERIAFLQLWADVVALSQRVGDGR